VLQRVVAEQPEVAGAAAWGNAGQHGSRKSADAFADAGIEIGGSGGLQLGFAALFHGQSAQAIGYHQDDFGGGRLAQAPDQVVDVHKGEFTETKTDSTVWMRAISPGLPVSGR